jgi:hypothetical protein
MNDVEEEEEDRRTMFPSHQPRPRVTPVQKMVVTTMDGIDTSV